MLKFHCGCGQKIGVPPTWTGRRVKCPQCGALNIVPREEPRLSRPESETALAFEMVPGQDELADEDAPDPTFITGQTFYGPPSTSAVGNRKPISSLAWVAVIVGLLIVGGIITFSVVRPRQQPTPLPPPQPPAEPVVRTP